jgi:hypothetical protein
MREASLLKQNSIKSRILQKNMMNHRMEPKWSPNFILSSGKCVKYVNHSRVVFLGWVQQVGSHLPSLQQRYSIFYEAEDICVIVSVQLSLGRAWCTCHRHETFEILGILCLDCSKCNSRKCCLPVCTPCTNCYSPTA